VVDVRREETAIHEANLLGIPVLALVDTNCDPRNIDYVIPSNDDAIRAIKLMASKIADAVLEGRALRKDAEEEAEEEFLPMDLEAMAEIEMTDEELLGEATLAKLQSGAFDEQLVVESDQPAPEEIEAELEIKGEGEQEAQLPDEAEEENQGETQDSNDSEVSEVAEDVKEDGE